MQTEIYEVQSLGINGVISKAESQYLATIQGVLMQDTAVGSAVGFGTNENEVVNTGLTAEKFLGFVVRDGYTSTCDTPSEIYKKGDTATIITKGSLFIKTPIALKQGDSVKIGANGVISTNGDINTGWRVSVGGSADEVIEITTQF